MPTLEASNFEQAEQLMRIVTELQEIKNKPVTIMSDRKMWLMTVTKRDDYVFKQFTPILGWQIVDDRMIPFAIYDGDTPSQPMLMSSDNLDDDTVIANYILEEDLQETYKAVVKDAFNQRRYDCTIYVEAYTKNLPHICVSHWLDNENSTWKLTNQSDVELDTIIEMIKKCF